MTRMRDPQRLRVLLSAYACLPGWGTEPGVGWHTARLMARHHDVWLLTYAGFVDSITRELDARPVAGLHVVGHSLPLESRRYARDGEWRSGLAEQAHYYAWQLSAAGIARRLHDRVGFDLAAHSTFVKYWAPSAVASLEVPFVWGPVGGGETAPASFYDTFSAAGLRYERKRDIARSVFERDPLVRRTARRAALSFATTEETRSRMRSLGASNVEVRSAIGLSSEEVESLAQMAPADATEPRFLCMGRLLAFKGYRFALESFARALEDGGPELREAELWIVGEGPERRELESLVRDLGIGGRVRMTGHVSRTEALRLLGTSRALIHPSLHESGGGVCLEAMAAGRPVVCFDLGGSAVHVDAAAGARIAASTPGKAVSDMALALRRAATDLSWVRQAGERGRAHVRGHFVWEDRVADLADRYRSVAFDARRGAVPASLNGAFA